MLLWYTINNKRGCLKMKKFFRNLFSGYFFVLLFLLIEIGILLTLQFGLDDMVANALGDSADMNAVKLIVALSYLLIRLVGFIISVVIFFRIINRSEDPEFKIPWIVGMLLLPFFFSILYLIFGTHKMQRKEKKIVLETKKIYSETFELTDDSKEKLGNAVGTFTYLNNTTKLSAQTNSKVTYYKTGEEFFPEMIESLKLAKEFIFMEFFIISDGKYWSEVKDILIDKAKAGVEVRLIYDDMGCGGTIKSRTPRILRKYGIKCFKSHPFRPVLSGVYNNRDHRKIVIIDHLMAYTGGMNLADEYGNVIKRFGYWKDSMIKIEGSGINNLIATFMQNYDFASGKVSDYEHYLNYEYPKFSDPGFVMAFGDGPGGVDNALIGEQTYINILNYAKKEVFISTPYLVPTYSLIDALRNASLRGVKVHLIVPGIPDKKMVYKAAESNFSYLLEAGVNIYRYKPGFNHMKTILADESLAMVGTINFDFRSLVHHFECGAVLYQNDCMQDILDDFHQMIDVSIPVPKDFKQKKSHSRFCSIIKLIYPLL